MLRFSRPVGVLLVVLASLAGAACSACDRSSAESSEGLPNVRLGMAPRDVRERFQPGSEGTWQTALGAGDDTVLEWTSRDPPKPGAYAHARFEFHLAMLVAIRARAIDSPRASGEQIALTPKTVTLHAAAREGGTTITVLARDCPTHKDEAESLVSRAK